MTILEFSNNGKIVYENTCWFNNFEYIIILRTAKEQH